VTERFPSVPVVVLTGLQDEQTAVDLLQQGAQDYINKDSLNEDQLVKAVRYAMERQEREQRLRTTTEQLEVLNRILRHDIQNDLQVIQLWSETLVGEVASDHEEVVQRMRQTAGHIRELTENSRAYIEAITGDGEMETEPTRLDPLLREEIEKARSRHGDAELVVAGTLPEVTVSAHPMLVSVFRNLLKNAVQHTDGRPTIEVAVERRAGSVRTTVADDGPGVPDDQKSEIFGKGAQGLDSDGTGIGLYLVYTLVTEFGGEVWVEDRDDADGGAVFVVELPVSTDDPERFTASD
jgi:signal transduction histidine kinase